MKQGLFICLLSLLFWGCTQNNGHIGVNFGMWKLEELTINGEPDTAYLVVRISDYHEVFECYGTWSESDDGKQMFLNFTYHDNGGTWKYVPLSETHLPEGLSTLDILSRSRGEMHLRHTADDGTCYEYRLEKW